MTEASSFMAFTQPQILFCGASPDAARRASPTLGGKLPVSYDKIRRHAAEIPIPPTYATKLGRRVQIRDIW
jgi:hypothetical protein